LLAVNRRSDAKVRVNQTISGILWPKKTQKMRISLTYSTVTCAKCSLWSLKTD